MSGLNAKTSDNAVDSVRLKIEPSGEPPLFLELGVGDFLIGRGDDCEVLIDHRDISRKHALLRVRREGVFVEDLGSVNGTYVDAHLADTATQFVEGQTVTLGADAIRIEIADDLQETVGVGNFRNRNDQTDLDLARSNYLFRKEIASGGMGTVLEAEDLNTGRQVAIKKMLQGSAATAEGQFRFQQEARIMGFLEHANIVPMHELGVNEKGIPYYTMKRVKGDTLQQVLSGIKAGDVEMIRKYPFERLLRIFQKVCDGIAFAHSKGVVHRDLKPENVLVGRYGEVMVMDWGLAKVLDRSPLKNTIVGRMPDVLDVGEVTEVSSSEVTKSGRFRTRDGEVLGTPNFMPPEQAEGRIREVDERSDIFSLGGILYSILTLRPPVTGDTVEEVLENMRSGYIPPPVIYNRVEAARLPGMGGRDKDVIVLRHCPGGQVPEPLSHVAMQAMALDPRKRYANVRELQLEVEAWQTGHVTRAEEAGFKRQLMLLISRHRSAAAAVFLVMIFGLFFLGQSIRAEMRLRDSLDQLRVKAPFFETEIRNLITAGDFESAHDRFDTLLKFLPDEPKYHLGKANMLQSMLRFDEASAAYREAEDRGIAAEVVAASLAACAELRNMVDEEGLTAEGYQHLIDHLNSQKRFSEAQRLAASADMDLGLSKEALQGFRALLLEQNAPEEVIDGDRVSLDRMGRLTLDLRRLEIDDLGWAAGVPFEVVDLSGTQIADLRPLRNMPVVSLRIRHLPVVDLSPLEGMELDYLDMEGTSVADLSVLGGMPLTNLNISGSRVTVLEPVGELAELRVLVMQSLELDSLDGLSGAGRLSELYAKGCGKLTDIAGIAGLSSLPKLDISGTRVKNLTPLANVRLRHVEMSGIPAPAESFEVLRGKSLARGNFNDTSLGDLSIFAGMAVVDLYLARVAVEDFSPLQELPLRRLSLTGTAIQDLSPLAAKELEFLDLSFTRVGSLAPLRSLGTRVQTLFLHGCNGMDDWKELAKIRGLSGVSYPAGMVPLRILAACPRMRRHAPVGAGRLDALRVQAWNEADKLQKFWNAYGREVGGRQ